MKKILATIGIVAIAAAALWLVVGRPQPAAPGNKLRVVTSFYPLYDFAQQVGAQHVAVTNMTPAGSEPHDYEPSPKLLADAHKAAVFIYNGGHLEPWTESFVRDYKHTAVQATRGISLRASTDPDHADQAVQDPHVWLDPVLAQHMVQTIRDGLTAADPAHKDDYAKNAARYTAELAQLDRDFQTGLARCQTRTLITAHQSLGYLAARYNLQAEAIAGLSPEQEPSPAKLAELARLVKEKSIRYIFFETLVSPRLADTIAAETGAKTLVFDPIEGLTNEAQKQGKNYLSLQRENLANLQRGLACFEATAR